jgi:hypothetical protein
LFVPDVAAQTPFTYWDNQKLIYGTDEHGYGRRTYDNVGVQYGLAALKKKQITIDEFLHLNDNIGGWLPPVEMQRERFWNSGGGQSSLADVSLWSHHNMTASKYSERPAPRSSADDEAIEAAYRSGNVFLGKIDMPILDFRHYLEHELDMHHSLQSFASRLRMQREQGHADNQLIWFADLPYEPFDEALDLMERWLENLRADKELSVVEAKPNDAADRCYADDGQLIAEGDSVWDGDWNGKPAGACTRAFPPYSNPRLIAGDDFAGDIMKCQLQTVDKAIEKGVYAPIDVRPHRDELQRIFPNGVCDYSSGDAARPDDIW